MPSSLNIEVWDTNPANNGNADSSINMAEGMPRSAVNDGVRGVMAAGAKLKKDWGGALVAGGTATALTVTSNRNISDAHIANGFRIVVRAPLAATGATNLAIDGLTARTILKNDGSAIAQGDWSANAILDLVYSSAASALIAVNLAPLASRLLTSGTVSAAATLDIVLTSYTAYRGIKFVLGGFRPATDGVQLFMRVSTNGGSSYDSLTQHYAYTGRNSSTGIFDNGGTSQAEIHLSRISIGNASTEGYNGEITLLNQTATAFWSRIVHQGGYIDSAGVFEYISGGGARAAAQDTDAVRFMFNSGNIAAGNYAVYGLT